MKTRIFGRTGRTVTEIGLGTWQLGTVWGERFNQHEAEKILETAFEEGITFIDTADVYNGGNSELTIGKVLNRHPGCFYITTKCGRRLNPHTAEMYTPEAVRSFVDGSLQRMGLERLDMILLHCPPSSVYRRDDIFTALDSMKQAGKLADYGVSIEKIEDGIAAMEYDIAAIEVIFNMFRHKPAEKLFPLAEEKNVGIIARVPLASGLLTGRLSSKSVFGPGDHRTYNREGASFDKGETFSGVPYETGLATVDALKQLFGTNDLVPYALRWILMHDAVSVVIPGASRVEQVRANVAAVNAIPTLTAEQMEGVRQIYDCYLRNEIHPQW